MSQTPKKSGGRDISDLKARLGLKKGGPGAPKSGGGIVAPPGMKSPPGAVPAPPGAKPPAPQMPSASEDPFAAMNAMAAVGVARQAPEIIVVNDGKPVEKVDARSRAITMGKYAAMILLPLIIGISMGQISKSAKAVNHTIEDAAVLSKDINRIRNAMQDNLLNPLLEAKSRGPGGAAFKSNDKDLTEALDGKDKLPVIDPEIAFSAYMFDMDRTLVADILAFYSEIALLKKDVENHVQAAKADAKLIEDGEKKSVEARPDPELNDYLKKEFYRYGIYIEVPSRKEAEQGAKFGARLVEIGPPVCQDRKVSSTGTCDGPPIGFGYRTAGGGEGWDLMEVGIPQGELVPGKKLLPLVFTGVFDSMIKGSESSVSEVSYMRRINDIYTRTEELVKLGTSLEKTLKAKANQSKSFTFFL